MTDPGRCSHPRFLILLCILIGLSAFGLRMVNCREINNNIDDLSARQAMMCIDITKGIMHFPHGPWLVEYDESGYAWLMVPWVILFGTEWAAFRLFAVILASSVPFLLTWIVSKQFNIGTGISAGLLLATMPAQLVWDRRPIMGAVSAISLLWLSALHLTSPPDISASHRMVRRCLIAGFLVAGSCYIAHYSLLILPAVGMSILLSSTSLRRRVRNLAVLLSAVLAGVAPLIFYHMNHPEYLLWRERHFHDSQFVPAALIKHFAAGFVSHLQELYPGGDECLFFRRNVPVLTLPVLLMVLAGTLYILRSRRRTAGLTLTLPVTLYVMMGFISTENWSGFYHAHAMPFFLIAAAAGLCGPTTRLLKNRSSTCRIGLLLIVLVPILGSNIHQFFKGRYAIHPRPDSLTLLQLDLKDQAPIPYIFSTEIHEVAHYHLPFWFATRTFQERISIAAWKDGNWVTDPDRIPIHFETSSSGKVGFVISPDLHERFVQSMGPERITGEARRLPRSGLLVIECRIDVPESLKRTWTRSMIPPLLPIVRDS